MGRGALDKAAITVVAVCAVVQAAQQALTSAPLLTARFPVLNLTGAWNYVPLALITLAGTLWLLERMLPSARQSPNDLKPAKVEVPSVVDGSRIVSRDNQPGGTPNMALKGVLDYVQKDSLWGQHHRPSADATIREVLDKLHLRRLSAWGRREPEGVIERIPAGMWEAMTFAVGGNAVMRGDASPVFYDVQFDHSYVYEVWARARL